MNEENFKQEIESRWRRRDAGNGKKFTGLFLLIIGALLLAKTMGVLFPGWFFTWPVLMIAIGLFAGIKHRFRRGPWFFFIMLGGIFLFDNINTDITIRPYVWPVALMLAGLYIILHPNRHRFKNRVDNNDPSDNNNFSGPTTHSFERSKWKNSMNDQSDVIDITAICSGIKKTVLSKNFKGGEITAIMGGTEINLTQADFTGKVMIDNFNMFGGTKFIVPPDWNVQSEVVAIFGGVDDKRPPATQHDPAKVILLDGTCIFGGIEIRSF